MTQRLLCIHPPLHLARAQSCTVDTLDDLKIMLSQHFEGRPARIDEEGLWREGHLHDLVTGTVFYCYPLTGGLRLCPLCGDLAPEVLYQEVMHPWCSCTKGEPL